MKKSIPVMLATMLLITLTMITGVHAIEVLTREMVEKKTVAETDLIRTLAVGTGGAM